MLDLGYSDLGHSGHGYSDLSYPDLDHSDNSWLARHPDHDMNMCVLYILTKSHIIDISYFIRLVHFPKQINVKPHENMKEDNDGDIILGHLEESNIRKNIFVIFISLSDL